MAVHPDIAITFLGHATFSFRTPGGKTFMVDPWLQDNPSCPDAMKQPANLDALLITHGHFDHIADAIRLGKELKPAAVVGAFEACEWLKGKGVENTVGMNKGGTVEVAGIHATMVHAVHSCGISDGDQIITAVHQVYQGLFPLAPSVTRDLVTEFSKLKAAQRSSILTDREAQILTLIAQGLNSAAIGEQLFISPSTVKREIQHIFNKLGVNDRPHAVSEGIKRNIIQV